MAERYFCPTVRAQSWEQAQAQINNRFQLLTRMLNTVGTGPNIPSSRLAQGTKIDGMEEEADVTSNNQTADKRALIIKLNAITPAHKIDVDADLLKLDTSTLRLTNVNLTIDLDVSGINGLDTGVLAADTWYSIWVIHNPTTATTAGLFSTSATSPTMPSGYTKKRRVAWARYGHESAFEEFYRFGDWWIYYSPREVLATAAAATSWTEIDCSDYVPPTSEMALLGIEVGSSYTSMARTSIRRKGSGGSGAFCLIGGRAWGVSDMRWWGLGIEMTCDAAQIIEYQSHVSSDILEIRIQGYYDHI